MLPLILILLSSVNLPDPDQIPTVSAGQEFEIDLQGDQGGWFRLLEDDYVCLSVVADGQFEMTAFDENGDVLCRAEPGEPLELSAFKDYWFYIRVVPSSPSQSSVDMRVEVLPPGELEADGEVENRLDRNMMAHTYTFIPDRIGSWTFGLEGSGGADLDLEVYGTGMRLWGSSMSASGSETVTVPVLPAESLSVVVSRYGKAGTGEYTLRSEYSGAFTQLKPSGSQGNMASGEIDRYMIPPHSSIFFLDLSILSPGADIDLMLRDMDGELSMSSQSYNSVETLLLYPSDEAAVADVVLFDPGDNEQVSYSLREREPGAVHNSIPAAGTMPAGSSSCPPMGFSPSVGGLFRIGVDFEKTRDGDVKIFRGAGAPSLTFASARGDEAFLLYVAAGDTVWIDPFYESSETSGDASVHIGSADAVRVENSYSGQIDSSTDAAFLMTDALAGTILDIGLSGADRDVDLDMLVSGPGIDLVAEGWVSNVDAAGDETVEVYSHTDAEYGVTVYLYDREGSTSYDLQVNRINRVPLADPSPEPETWVLCAGISGYPSAADILNRASMDAVEFYDFVTDEQEIPLDHVILLVDELSTVDQFIDGMSSLLERAGPEDKVIVFFSGHGDRSYPGSGGPEEDDSANEYICMYDGEISDDTISALVDSLANAPVFLFFDSCHSGGFVNDFAPGSGVMVLTAAREDLSVSERVLTPILLQGSRGDADSDGNGYVSALELMRYIDGRLQLICPECDAELQPNTFVCPQCGAILKGEDAVPRPEQGDFLDEDIPLWRVGHQ